MMLRHDATRSSLAGALVVGLGFALILAPSGCNATAPAAGPTHPARTEVAVPSAPERAKRPSPRTTVSMEGTGPEGEAIRESLEDLGQRVAARCAPPNAGLLRVVFEHGRLLSVEVWPEAAREAGTHACVVEQIAIANLASLRDGADGEPLPASVLIRVEW